MKSRTGRFRFCRRRPKPCANWVILLHGLQPKTTCTILTDWNARFQTFAVGEENNQTRQKMSPSEVSIPLSRCFRLLSARIRGRVWNAGAKDDIDGKCTKNN